MPEIICTIEKHQALFNLILTATLALATIVLAVATVYLWRATRGLWSTTKDMLAVTKEAIVDTRRASWGTIILQANRDFFFNDRMYKVRKTIESNKPVFESKGGDCTVQDVEDYIGYFDTLYGFIEQGILDAKITDDNFGAYVEEAHKNKEIQDYIAGLRGDMDNEELYTGFEKWGREEFPKS